MCIGFDVQCEIQILKVIYCQGRGISPSHIKHVKYVKRFLVKSADNHITEVVKERKTSEVLRGITVWKIYFLYRIQGASYIFPHLFKCTGCFMLRCQKYFSSKMEEKLEIVLSLLGLCVVNWVSNTLHTVLIDFCPL